MLFASRCNWRKLCLGSQLCETEGPVDVHIICGGREHASEPALRGAALSVS